MKKILYLLCMMLTVMSCNENTDYEADNTHGQNPDGTYTLSLTLEDPGKTKAPVTMARYVLEMYEKDLSSRPIRATSSTGSIDVIMKKGVDYICLFWADDNVSYNVDNLKAVCQKTETDPGTPAYAAVKTINTDNFDGAITLKRAVSEINFIEKEGSTNVDNNLKITYPYGWARLNIANGTVTRTPGITVRVIKGAVSPAAGATLATDYVLASTAKETLSGVKLQLNYYIEKTLTSAAIQANYKTQVTGAYVIPPETRTVTINGVNFDFVLVKAGTYEIGAIKGSNADYARYVYSWVKLTKSYYIGKTEVTQAQWKAVMGKDAVVTTYGPSKPVQSVSWLDICGGTYSDTTVPDADCFLTKIKAFNKGVFRLPTSTEWECAARGGHKTTGYMTSYTKYVGTNDENQISSYDWYNFKGGSTIGSTIQDVAKKLPNILGLYDMGGNVMEWCSDEYIPYDQYKNYCRPAGTLEAPIIDPEDHPNTPNEKNLLRGGSYATALISMSIYEYHELVRRGRDYTSGFRLVLVP